MGVLLIVFEILSFSLWAHPHALVEMKITFVFDDEGLAEIRSDWRYDSTISMDMFSINDNNENGFLEDAEIVGMVKELGLRLEESEYFTHLRIDGKPQPIITITDASATVNNQRICFSYVIPCKIPRAGVCREVRISQYDPSYYTAFLFSDLSFDVVNEELVDWRVEKRKNTEESYYGGMVHPEELVLHFWEKGTTPVFPEDSLLQTSTQEAVENDSVISARVQFTITAPKRLIAASYALIVRGQQALQRRFEAIVGESGDNPLQASSVVFLCLLAFIYGGLHSIGPGHGKFITSSYLVGSKSTLAHGILLGSVLAISHGTSGALVVIAGRFILGVTADAMMGDVDAPLKIMSFSMIAMLGVILFFLELVRGGHEDSLEHTNNASNGNEKHTGARSVVFLALVTGMAPCPGVVIVMLFCSGSGHIALGILLAACVTIGMALSLSFVAVIAVSAKNTILNNAHFEQRWLPFAEKLFRLIGSGMLVTIGVILVFLEVM